MFLKPGFIPLVKIQNIQEDNNLVIDATNKRKEGSKICGLAN